MIFERRRYTVRAGMHSEFIRLQHVRGFDGAIGAIMSRLIGYDECIMELVRPDLFPTLLCRRSTGQASVISASRPVFEGSLQA